MTEEPKLLQLHGKLARVFRQVRRNQHLDTVLLDQLIAGDVSPPGNVGIDRYLSGGTRSRRDANQVYRGPPALTLNVFYRPIAECHFHGFDLPLELGAA